MERAKSLANPVIRLTLMPAAGWISNRVTTGPGRTSTTVALIPKSCSLTSKRRDKCSRDSSEKPVLEDLSWTSRRFSGGRTPTSFSSTNRGCCFSRSTRLLFLALTSGALIVTGLRCFFILVAASTLLERTSLASLAIVFSI